MDEILNLSINEMPQTEFDCSCGKHHNFSVHDMSIRKGALAILTVPQSLFITRMVSQQFAVDGKKIIMAIIIISKIPQLR